MYIRGHNDRPLDGTAQGTEFHLQGEVIASCHLPQEEMQGPG